MADKSLTMSTNSLFKDRFLFLLVSLMGMMVFTQILEEFTSLKILMDIFITLVFMSSIYAVSNKKSFVFIASALALPMFISLWEPHIGKIPLLALTGELFGILFMAFIIVEILSFIFKERNVSSNVIYASIVVYLLLAVMWAFIFKVVESLQPGSFTVPHQIAGEGRALFSYYSFVTITTLGYGDIAPIKGLARAFSILEAVVGQTYLVILVSRLVGINIAQAMNKEG
jgi:hypothetical protein